MLLYSTKDGKIVLIDSHQHGEKMGPVIVKGTCSHLAEFLNRVQEVLNMNETSYTELILYICRYERVKHNILEKTRVIRKLSIYDSILKL